MTENAKEFISYLYDNMDEITSNTEMAEQLREIRHDIGGIIDFADDCGISLAEEDAESIVNCNFDEAPGGKILKMIFGDN